MEASTSGRTINSAPNQQLWISHAFNAHARRLGTCDRGRQQPLSVQQRRGGRLSAVAETSRLEAAIGSAALCNQHVRDGHSETRLVEEQASKEDSEQPSIAAVLQPFDALATTADVCVVGCGPAGLALAAELGSHGLSVALIGHDVPFVNNYGVWKDEFRELGLESTLDVSWDDAMCYFGETKEVRVGRGYGRVCRRRLRHLLLQRCKASGVHFRAGEVARIQSVDQEAEHVTLTLSDRTTVRSRLVTLAAGAAAGKFLRYEHQAPTVAAQTAYGIEVELESYRDKYDGDTMLFMDFRRHHSGLWDGTAPRLTPGEHPVAGEGLWGTQREVPSFLYAMPVDGGRVFLEETCLVAKPPLPFSVLKRRLERRLGAMGLKVKHMIEEEWSYIPVGGPLPLGDQPVTAFGAAANLVHPATGYSIARSLREAPALAVDMAAILRKDLSVQETSRQVWNALWPAEKRRQAAFHVFGMELLARLDLKDTNAFFSTFFRLPDFFWRGFLSSSLTSSQLIAFALLTFVMAPGGIQLALMRHLITHPAGSYLIRHYLGLARADKKQPAAEPIASDAAVRETKSSDVVPSTVSR